MHTSHSKSFRVRLDANAAKVAALDAVLVEWNRIVHDRIDLFWDMPITAFACLRAPLGVRLGGSLIRRATDRAWAIVRGAKRNQRAKPNYEASEIDFDEASCHLSFNHETMFDGWLEVQTLVYRKRAALPFRSYRRLNESDNPQSDFVCEELNFKGKRKRSRSFRSRQRTFAYQHLAGRLEDLGSTEGFGVFKVNPAYTSQTCPECGHVEKGNRQNDSFCCLKCGHSGHADVVAAINLAQRKEGGPVGRVSSTDSFPNPASRVSGDVQCPDQKGDLARNGAG